MGTFDLLLLALLGGAVYTDLRRRRIPNWLTLPFMLGGLLLNGVLHGGSGVALSAQGWVVGLLLLLVPFAMRWMGAGDVKLLAAIGALEGPNFVVATALVGAVAGGLAAVIILARQRRLRSTLGFLYALWNQPNVAGSPIWARMPYGPALAAGAMVALFLERSL